MHYEIVYSCISHIGNVRSINQDNFICNGTYMKTNDSEIIFPLNGKVVSKSPTLLRALKKVCFSQTKDIPFSCMSKNQG